MKDTTGTLQPIVKRERYITTNNPMPSAYSVIITIKCGCEIGYKGSQEPKSQARCRGDCQRGKSKCSR